MAARHAAVEDFEYHIFI